MPSRYAREISYEEFVGRVRRHRPSDLLPQIALAAIDLSASGDFLNRGGRILSPWALGVAAKESIAAGNEHRRPGATQRDVAEICAAYNAIRDPLTTGDGTFESQPHSFFVRMSTEQFPFQISHFEEISRLIALFGDLSQVEADLETLDDGLLHAVLGTSVTEYAGAAFVFAVGAQRNRGYFDLGWLTQPNFSEIIAVIPAETLEDVFKRHFAIRWEDFRREVELNREPTGRLRRYEFNPLVARPFVEMPDGRYLAPQPEYVFQRITPTALYYQALETLRDRDQQDAFTRDVGLLFQDYIGKQLALLPSAALIPEIRFDGQRSVDWFLVWDDLVVLVEVKSTRLTLWARMGMPNLEADLNRALGLAMRQVKTSDELIGKGHPAFHEVPPDKKRVALTVTLEPYWMANSPLLRPLISESTPNITTSVVSARELEHWVAASLHGNAPELLIDVLEDPQQREWMLSTAMETPEDMPKNPILEEAWFQTPWNEWRTQAGQTED